jgi:hypothetical protein
MKSSSLKLWNLGLGFITTTYLMYWLYKFTNPNDIYWSKSTYKYYILSKTCFIWHGWSCSKFIRIIYLSTFSFSLECVLHATICDNRDKTIFFSLFFGEILKLAGQGGLLDWVPMLRPGERKRFWGEWGRGGGLCHLSIGNDLSYGPTHNKLCGMCHRPYSLRKKQKPNLELW